MTKNHHALLLAALILFAPSDAPAPVNEGSYEILENGAGKFRVEIEGCPQASANVESITMEDLVIDAREVTSGTDWKYRAYEPGDAHFGSITIRSRVLPGIPSCLAEWASTCSGGFERTKPVSVVILKRDGTEARRYDFSECFPTSYLPPPDPFAPDAVEEIVVQPTGFSCDADLPDETELDRTVVINGFAVALGTSTTGAAGGVDATWESAQGGAEQKEKKALKFIDPTDETQARLKGARSISVVALRGPMTPSRKALCQWITETVRGEFPRLTVSLSEVKDKGRERTFNYLDAFPTRYVFPSLSASGTGDLYEEVTMKPIRLELS
jgi:phage tail-like protein